jgi:flagellar P-ring protein precursor FlgI
MHKLLINFKRSSLLVLTALLMTGQFLFLSQAAAQQRIKEIAAVAGERSNQLIGYGLVVGLDGSGDQTTQSPFTLQSTLAMLQSLGVAIPPGVSAQTRNIAAVMVTSELPALARPGQKIDLTISSIGNAKSLRGGTLLMTPLRGADLRSRSRQHFCRRCRCVCGRVKCYGQSLVGGQNYGRRPY